DSLQTHHTVQASSNPGEYISSQCHEDKGDIAYSFSPNKSSSPASGPPRPRGRPGGRIVYSSPSSDAVSFTHPSPPYGPPRPPPRRSRASSASVSGRFTYASQSGPRPTGPASSHGNAVGVSRSHRLDQRQSSARLTRFARNAFRST